MKDNIAIKGKVKERSQKQSLKIRPIIIRSRDAFLRAIDEMKSEKIIGIDIENDNFYRYSERLCLIQIRTQKKIFLFDCLASGLNDIEPFREIFENPHIKKILHDGHQDIQLLKKHFNLSLVNVFDTQVAARYLGIVRYGLKKLIFEFLKKGISKEESQADWSKRPLSDKLVAYAADDVRYLIELYHRLVKELSENNRLEDAEEHFSFLQSVEPSMRVFNPDSFYKIPGAKKLPEEKLPTLKALNEWREQKAKQRDRPHYMIIHDDRLIQVITSDPQTEDDWNRILGKNIRYKQELQQVIQQAKTAEPVDVSEIKNLRRYISPELLEEQEYDLAFEKRLNSLINWRREQSKEEELDPDLILPKDILIELSRENPKSVAELNVRLGFSEYRVNKYGQRLIEAFKESTIDYKCILCGKELLENTVIARCPHCRAKFHLQEILEIIKQNPSCPNCSQRLSLN